MADDLPVFRYHPDPVETGSVREGPEQCESCGRSRGYIYVGPVYAVDEPSEGFCPWCIADGSASAGFTAEFTDVDGTVPVEVPPSVTEQIARRTPGFSGWQQEHWLYHCSDGMAFVGPVGAAELEEHDEALESLRREHDGLGWSIDRVTTYLGALSKVGPPTAYLFRCLHCSRELAYSDFT